jgi:CRISPR/Cas system CMR-associated protein Cmr3 (group 5 of RAMP superfamily)
MGMWKAFFAWHIEDMNLCSINYVHVGAPKQWYFIAPNQAAKFEEIAHQLFPAESRNCSEFIRHKTSLITPAYLESKGIKILVATQQQKEFIVIYPKVYHCGFNYGFNCAEAVNFANESWITAGREAKWCECRSAVTIPMVCV